MIPALQSLRATALRMLRGTPQAAAVPRDKLADAPLEVLAAKIVFSHVRNRQQLLGPPPTALGHLDQGETELMIGAAIAAAHASGRFDEDRERRLRAALSASGLQVETSGAQGPMSAGFVSAAIRDRHPVDTLLDRIESPHLASLFYAASLLAIDKGDPIDRAYLAFLAARLHLAPETLARLHSQYGIE